MVKQWFPFAEYEFYAFVAAGMLLIAAVDYTLAGGGLVDRASWTIVQGVFWTIVAYLIGQVCAVPSSGLIEHIVARRVLTSPAKIQLGLSTATKIDRIVGLLFAAREFAPLSEKVRERAIRLAEAHHGCLNGSLDAEDIYQTAFPYSRSVADSAARLNTFMNQYGMSRNVCFVGLIATPLLTYHFYKTGTNQDLWLSIGSFVITVGMFARFVKYYSLYSMEVLRTFAAKPA